MYDVCSELDLVEFRVICLHLNALWLSEGLQEVPCQEEHIESNETYEVHPDQSVVGNHFIVDCLDSLADCAASIENDKQVNELHH